jgi:hypothetical protein
MFDRLVTLASAFLQAFEVKNLNLTSIIFYQACLLKSFRCQGHAGTAHAQHLGYEFLGKIQGIAAAQISAAQQPPAQTLSHLMICHAGCGLLRLSKQCLLVTD